MMLEVSHLSHYHSYMTYSTFRWNIETTYLSYRGNWVQERAFVLDGTAYETFGEARAAELMRNATFKPAVVRPSTNGAVK